MRFVVVALAGLGTHYVATATLLGRRDLRLLGRSGPTPGRNETPARWLRQAGLEDVDRRQFASASIVSGLVVGLLSASLAGAAMAVGAALAGMTAPALTYRHRRRARRERAREAWPAIIEEIRVRAGPAGLSVPQALFTVGRRAPEEMRWAFVEAERTWTLTTDFELTVDELRKALADHTADVVLETLLVAHGLGGAAVGARLDALAEDRAEDLAHRREAHARLAGARFARLFVLLVPIGMAGVGMSLGRGAHAYTTATGQALVLAAVAVAGGCWIWAGRLMRLAPPSRVFAE